MGGKKYRGAFWKEDEMSRKTCPVCNGSGKCPKCRGSKGGISHVCSTCNGSGKCPSCGGEGVVSN